MELFLEVQRLRKLRSDAHFAKQRVADPAPAGFRPLGRGLILKYLLAGLVRCAHCGTAMRTIPSKHTETSKSGRVTVYKYVHHSCPRHAAGGCGNGHYFCEDKLREAVISRVRAKLFPKTSDGTLPAWLPALVAQVDADIARREEHKPDRTAARKSRLGTLEKQQKGWMLSLADPDLPLSVRKAFQGSLASAAAEADDLRAEAESEAAHASVKDRIVNPRVVLEALGNLDVILNGENPTLGNLELSRHIDRIDCHADGKVVLHGTMLGVLGEGTILLTRSEAVEEVDEPSYGYPKITPRRRTRRYVPNLSAQEGKQIDQIQLLDSTRFEGFGREFFWEEEVFLEEKLPWYQVHSGAVGRERLDGKTHEELAAQFGVTVPTIRAALKHAAKSVPELLKLPRKMPRSRWEDSHYDEVARRKIGGESVAKLAAAFDVSEPLIRNALRIAASKGTSEVVTPADNPGVESD